jgi:hypothetical protein
MSTKEVGEQIPADLMGDHRVRRHGAGSDGTRGR